MADDLKVGDVIEMKGSGVPGDLEGRFFRVEAVGGDDVRGWRLSRPYLDKACTKPYHPPLQR